MYLYFDLHLLFKTYFLHRYQLPFVLVTVSNRWAAFNMKSDFQKHESECYCASHTCDSYLMLNDNDGVKVKWWFIFQAMDSFVCDKLNQWGLREWIQTFKGKVINCIIVLWMTNSQLNIHKWQDETQGFFLLFLSVCFRSFEIIIIWCDHLCDVELYIKSVQKNRFQQD